jgi:hypothetical protein
MKVYSKVISLCLILAIIAGLSISAPQTTFAEEGKIAKVNGVEIGTVQKDGSILLNVSKSSGNNQSILSAALGDNKKRTVVLPKGKVPIYNAIFIGSNKTIKAKGATVYQNSPDTPILINSCTKTNYKSLKNVTINGGVWTMKKIDKPSRSTSTFRFAHANNIKIKNARVDTNYISHALEIIACKKVLVENCKLIAKGKQKNDIYAEPLQIDISTKATAPVIAQYGKKFVKGQTCKNITVKNCTVKGSRGICTNKTDTEGGKWLKKHHFNVKIIGCKVTGMKTEALCLHNVAGVTVKNNKAYSKGSDYNYNIGCYLASFGNNKKTSKYANVFSKNTIKGGRNGLYIATYKGNKFGKTTIKSNKLYAKSGSSVALGVSGCTKTIIKNNKKYKWK